VGAIAALAALAVTVAILAATGWLTIRGWDWAIGTNTRYCGIYWPDLDLYCQAGS
jgi:hypothetical protein